MSELGSEDFVARSPEITQIFQILLQLIREMIYILVVHAFALVMKVEPGKQKQKELGVRSSRDLGKRQSNLRTRRIWSAKGTSGSLDHFFLKKKGTDLTNSSFPICATPVR